MIRVLNRMVSTGGSSSSPRRSDASRKAVFQAAGEGQVHAIMVYRQQGVHLADLEDEKKSSLIHIAARDGQPEMVQLLLTLPEFLGMVNRLDKTKRTPLHLAAAMGHDEVVHLLLRFGASLDCMDQACWTPLHWAVYGDHGPVCETLLESRADPHKKGAGLSLPSAYDLLAVEDGESESKKAFERLAVKPKVPPTPTSDGTTGATFTSGSADSPAKPNDIPGAWVAFRTEGGKTYYWNRRDNSTTWALPPAARVAWYTFKTPQGEPYYWNERTKATVWHLPTMQEDDLASEASEVIHHQVIGVPELKPQTSRTSWASRGESPRGGQYMVTSPPNAWDAPVEAVPPPPRRSNSLNSHGSKGSRHSRTSRGSRSSRRMQQEPGPNLQDVPEEPRQQPQPPQQQPAAHVQGEGAAPGGTGSESLQLTVVESVGSQSVQPTTPLAPASQKGFRRGASNRSVGSSSSPGSSHSPGRLKLPPIQHPTPPPQDGPASPAGVASPPVVQPPVVKKINSTDLLMEDAEKALHEPEANAAAQLQGDISRAILAKDALGLQATIEVARGILESGSLEEAKQALEELKQQGTSSADKINHKHAVQVKLAEALQKGRAEEIGEALEEAKSAGCSPVIIARAEDHLKFVEEDAK